MTVACSHFIIRTQKLLNGLHFCRRFHNYKIFCHYTFPNLSVNKRDNRGSLYTIFWIDASDFKNRSCKIYKCGKVLNFAGPYSITLAIVYTGNYFNDRPMYGIDVVTDVEFKTISSDYISTISNDRIIITKDHSYFEQMINEVLYKIDNYID